MSKKIYISGKITGLATTHARSIFTAIERKITDAGHTPVNPMSLKHDHDKRWESYMKVDIAELLTCDAIYLMQGWHESKGACIEYNLAKELGIEVYFEYSCQPKLIPHKK